MAKTTKRKYLFDLDRPHCPECHMRMMAVREGSTTFECLRCGYIGPVSDREAAE